MALIDEIRERDELLKELGGKCTDGINWCWYEFPTMDAAETFADYLKDAGYERVSAFPGWRQDNADKCFVKYHR